MSYLVTFFKISLAFCFVSSIFAQDMDLDKIKEDLLKTVNQNIKAKNIPGAVVLIGTQKDGTLLFQSYGKRSLVVDNTTDTIYDIASMSKVFTALAVAKLVDQNLLKFSDRVATYLNEFDTDKKREITIAQLLRHKSGYPAVNYMRDYNPQEFSIEQMWQNILNIDLRYTPGAKTVYSDLGFMILSQLVERISGLDFATFVAENIFIPLDLSQTTFHPSLDSLARVAPTDNEIELGLPHDPRCRAIGGASGNAGIFSTAKDIEKLSRFFLNRGLVGANQVISQNVIEQMIALEDGEIRGLGLSVVDPYSNSLRGSYIPKGQSFGHSGYTGTSFWIDDLSDFYIIILTNRVLLGDSTESGRAIVKMRRDIANIVGQYFYQNP